MASPVNNTVTSLEGSNSDAVVPSLADLANCPPPAPNLTSAALVSALQASIQGRLEKNAWFIIPPPKSAETLDFSLGDYLSLTSSNHLRDHLLSKIIRSPAQLLGSGGSRLLVNPDGFASLEARLETFFHIPKGGALLFQSGFLANLSFLSAIPQPGDVVVFDEYIHASMHEGLRGCRAEKQCAFRHNNLGDLRRVLKDLVTAKSDLGNRLRSGKSTVLLAVESLYSMDGTLAPLSQMVQLLEELLPLGNGVMFVDEAHTTGIYGPDGRGRVTFEGLENHPRILARLSTFGKALGNAGAVLLTEPLIIRYLVNYGQPIIYSTAPTNLSIMSISCSFDMLEDGTARVLAEKLLTSCKWFVETFKARLKDNSISKDIMYVNVHAQSEDDITCYTPVVPVMIPPRADLLLPTRRMPRQSAVELETILRSKHSIIVRAMMFPIVPKGQDRLRVCLNVAHSRKELKRFMDVLVDWAVAERKDRSRPRAVL